MIGFRRTSQTKRVAYFFNLRPSDIEKFSSEAPKKYFRDVPLVKIINTRKCALASVWRTLRVWISQAKKLNNEIFNS